MNKRVLLMILDGWGIGDKTKSDVIYTTRPEYITAMTERYPHATLLTDGENVGLPEGQMGNSEVGHLNIGAGRVVYQDLVRVNKAVEEKGLDKNEVLLDAFNYAKKNNKAVHLIGLVSDGGVHSHINHLKGLCTIAHNEGVKNLFIGGAGIHACVQYSFENGGF
jgi:2,3-bisphosphoglycerate-independent phosphoglycerate mutase